jgi:hypothetical protein
MNDYYTKGGYMKVPVDKRAGEHETVFRSATQYYHARSTDCGIQVWSPYDRLRLSTLHDYQITYCLGSGRLSAPSQILICTARDAVMLVLFATAK